MSVFILQPFRAANALDLRPIQLPPGVHVTDVPKVDHVLLSNGDVYVLSGPASGRVKMPITGTIPRARRIETGVLKFVSNGVVDFFLPDDDQRVVWGMGHAMFGRFYPRDPMVDIYKRTRIVKEFEQVDLNAFLPRGANITKLSLTLTACCAALDNGSVFLWGNAELVKRKDWRWQSSGGVKIIDAPRFRSYKNLLRRKKKEKVISLASGNGHVLWVVKGEGEVGGWVCVYGANGAQQCGVDGRERRFCDPHRIENIRALSGKVKSVSCGPSESFALTVGGRIFAWGRRVGLGIPRLTGFSISTPTEVIPPKLGVVWLKLAGGQDSIALYGTKKDGILGLATWGVGGGTSGREPRPYWAVGVIMPPQDIDYPQRFEELLMYEDPRLVNIVGRVTIRSPEPHVIFTRDDFRQEFDDEEVEERLDFGEESGMYERVERNIY